MRGARGYREYLLQRLRRNPSEAAHYLNAAIKEGHDAFLIALKDVVDANGGASHCSGLAGIHRDTLYKMCREDANPTIKSLSSVLEPLGLSVAIQAWDRAKNA
jgi:DNA-binding phage protein